MSDTTHRYGLSVGELEALSVELEDETGYDSIPTIEKIYDSDCPFPDCDFCTRDAVRMWKHVHFGSKHPRSFGLKLADLIAERRSTP